MNELADAIIKISAVIGASAVIITLIYKIFKFFDNQKKQDFEIEKLKKRVAEENTLICYGLSACLDGLQQLGANHSVPDAKEKLDKYLNQQAHK